MDLSRQLIRWIENLLIVGLVAMVMLVFGNVVLRYGFNSGIIQAEELSRVIFVWLTFGGAFLVARQGGHLGMTAFVGALGPSGRKLCRGLSQVLSIVCLGLVLLGSWRQIVINIDNFAPITGIPLATTFMAAFAGGLGILALNVIALFRLLSGRMQPGEYVVGVESEELAALEGPAGERKP
ncbi:DctM TRAP-type C4-dicarboxylate transport system, small permease component [Rhabdaerophilaceae bacterium]